MIQTKTINNSKNTIQVASVTSTGDITSSTTLTGTGLNITGGTVNLPNNSISLAALPISVPVLTSPNTWTNANTFSNGLTVSGTLNLPVNSIADTALSTNVARYNTDNTWSGINSFQNGLTLTTGALNLPNNSIKSAHLPTDTFVLSYTATPSISYTDGQIYYMRTTNTVVSLAISNIPITPRSRFIFVFYFSIATPNNQWHMNSSTVTLNGSSTTLSFTTGTSGTVNFPATYTYLVQTITILNTSATSTPSWKALNSVQGF